MIGQAVFDLGGGRINKDASIDYDAVILLLKEHGDIATHGTPTTEVYSNSEIRDVAMSFCEPRSWCPLLSS